MPDPIPRNRSAHGRRGRRLARQRGWRGVFRRTLDDVGGADPTMPQQCTLAGPALRLDQPLRRTHDNATAPPPAPAPADRTEPLLRPPHDPDNSVPAPPPPLPEPLAPAVQIEHPIRPIDSNTGAAPPQVPAPRPDQPLPRTQDDTEQAPPRRPQLPALRPDQPLRRSHDNAEQQAPPPPPPRPPAGPASRRRQPLRRVRANAEPPRPRPGGQRRAGTDVVIGASLVASVALVAGLTLPLLSSIAPSDPTAAPPASEHAGTAPAPDSHDNPGAPADQPGEVAAVNHSPARGAVTLLADRTAAASGVPAHLPAPAQPAGVGGPVLLAESPAADPDQRYAGTGYSAPGQHAAPPAPPIQPSRPPDPQSEYEREQLARLAQLLAQLPHSQGGTTAPDGFPKGGGPSPPGRPDILE
jgi:hypothetical protein